MAVFDASVTLQELRASLGRELVPVVAPAISPSDIRKFAIALYWPETPPRLFWDEQHARQTKWGGIIAPEDFNPFAWPISGPSFFPAQMALISGGRRYFAWSNAEYGERMRPGDVITARERVAEITERWSRSGLLVFVEHEVLWHNQDGALVKKLRAAFIHIPPPEAVT